MKTTSIPIQFIAFCLLFCGGAFGEEGTLVIVGGGGTPDTVIARSLELAGGVDSRVIILPQASSREDRGQSSVKMFADKGATNVAIVDTDDPTAARKKIEAANLIWFPGGQQSRLMDALTEADLVDAIVARHKAGATIGGTSAGAAVMAQDMIPRSPDEQALKFGNTPIVPGLGLAPKLIVDQHFVRRARMNRLLSAVIDRPQRVGMGIGERTAVLWRSSSLQVLGEGSVVVIDARQATIPASPPGTLQVASDIRLQILKSGERFEWQTQ